MLGKLTVTLAGGQSKTVKLALNRAGRQSLASRHTLKARHTISQSGKTVAGRMLAFKVKPQKRRRSQAVKSTSFGK